MAHTPAAASNSLLSRSESLLDCEPPVHSRTSTTAFKSPESAHLQRENSVRSLHSCPVNPERSKPTILGGAQREISFQKRLILDETHTFPNEASVVTSTNATPEKTSSSTSQSREQPRLFSPPGSDDPALPSPSKMEDPSVRVPPGSFDDMFGGYSMGTLPASFATERIQPLNPAAAAHRVTNGSLTSPPEFDVSAGCRRGGRPKITHVGAMEGEADFGDGHGATLYLRRLSRDQSPIAVGPRDQGLQSLVATHSGQFTSPPPNQLHCIAVGNTTPPSKSREPTPILPTSQPSARFASIEDIADLRQTVSKLTARICVLEQQGSGSTVASPGSKIPATVVNRALQPPPSSQEPEPISPPVKSRRFELWRAAICRALLVVESRLRQRLRFPIARDMRGLSRRYSLAYPMLVLAVIATMFLSKARRDYRLSSVVG